MKFRNLVWSVSLALASLAAQAADETVTLNLANADVSMVLKLASEVTGKMFVLDPKVKGSVTGHYLKQAPVCPSGGTYDESNIDTTGADNPRSGPS